MNQSRRLFILGIALLPAATVRAGNPFDLFTGEGRVHLAPGSGYGRYARRLLKTLPANVHLRPDLEDWLDILASRARQRAGRSALVSSPLAKLAARAQAADMLLGSYVGHYSRSGYSFARRFEAVAGAGHGNFGENAARDRQRGPVDRAKATRLFRQWLDSAGHRRNLLRPEWRYVSTGALAYGQHLYAVQIFWQK